MAIDSDGMMAASIETVGDQFPSLSSLQVEALGIVRTQAAVVERLERTRSSADGGVQRIAGRV